MTRTRNGKGDFERSITTAKRDAEAAQLRTDHLTYDQIAEQLGFTDRSHAYKAVQRALKATVREPAEELRTLEIARLDKLSTTTQRVINESDDLDLILKAIDRHLKIQARRAALLGLDAPTKAEHTGPKGGPLQVDVTEYTPEQMRRRADQIAAEVGRAYEDDETADG